MKLLVISIKLEGVTIPLLSTKVGTDSKLPKTTIRKRFGTWPFFGTIVVVVEVKEDSELA